MILFPTNLSDHSAESFAYALELAKKLNSPIQLLYVYNMPVLNPATVEMGSDAVTEELLNATDKAAENKMAQFKEDLAARYANSNPDMVRVNSMIRMGLIGDEILSVAQSVKADYIVLGIRHHKGLERIISGNTTMHVINKSEVPVITVPENYKTTGVRSIGYATDLTFNDNEIISKLLALAKTLGATVKCFHVHDSKLEIENSIIADFIEQYRAEANAGLITFQLVDNLNTIDGIDYFVKEHNIDLLCVMRQKHYWLAIFEKSTTKKLVFHEDIPLLIFHE